MARFKTGDKVRRAEPFSSLEYKNAVGAVALVIPSDTDVPELTIYDIEFLFGIRTLYGDQIEAA